MIDLIETELEKLIPLSSPFYPSLLEGARYALLAPGKRIRPLLTLYTATILDKKSVHKAIKPACAIELVHCYSLIHDDLPCMDNQDFRRGRLTLHKTHNEATAILIGNYLLTLAFDLLTSIPDLSCEKRMALLAALTHAAGKDGIIGGQIMDIENHQNLSELNRRKTAALFRCAVNFGGIIANAPQSILIKLDQFGELFGELFQIVDDILDQDYPLGEDKARERQNTLTIDVLKALKALPGDTSSLRQLIESVLSQIKKSSQPDFEDANSNLKS
ncbi:MAG: polyprenyl synthetase family protein [Chlamydiales bacterium]